MLKVSTVIPSRLQENLNGVNADGVKTLWLDRAINSVIRQDANVEHEIIVGLSPGHPEIPERFKGPIKFVVAERPGQAAAVNAAAAAATGEVFAFLEDDDYWRSLRKLTIQLAELRTYSLVTSNQREITWNGQYVRVNDFATPSGWLMAREAWERIGGFDESFRFHVDTEWLGRAHRHPLGPKRLHLIERGAMAPGTPVLARQWLGEVARYSHIAEHDEPDPLVERMVNPEGGMALIASNPEAAEQSMREHRRMLETFGVIPW